MSTRIKGLPVELVAAVSGASRAIGELDAALHVSAHRDVFVAELERAGADWPSLNMAMRCASHELEVLDVTNQLEKRPSVFNSLKDAAQWAASAVRTADSVYQQHVDLVGRERVSRYAVPVLDLLVLRGELTVGTVVEQLGVSPSTGGSLLGRMEDLGIVEEVTGRRRDRVYRYSPFLDCFDTTQSQPRSLGIDDAGDMSVAHHSEPGDSLADFVPIIVNIVFAGSDAERIVVFGSLARNEQGPDSDIDLLVVLPHVISAHDDAVRIMQLLRDLPVAVDVLVTDPDRLVLQSKIPGIVRAALREGRTYERAA